MQTETKQVQHNEQRTETETENLAAVLGPTLMALTASEALNYNIWDTQFPAVTYLNGLFIFVAGVSPCGKNIGGPAVGQSRSRSSAGLPRLADSPGCSGPRPSSRQRARDCTPS